MIGVEDALRSVKFSLPSAIDVRDGVVTLALAPTAAQAQSLVPVPSPWLSVSRG